MTHWSDLWARGDERRLDAKAVQLEVLPHNSGVMALAAPTPVLLAEVVQVLLRRRGDDLAHVVATVPVASLTVTQPAGEAERQKIGRLVRDDLLQASRFPEARFEGEVRRQGERLHVDGGLTLKGATRPLAFVLQQQADAWRGELELVQSAYGIRPAVAFFGALRSRDEVALTLSVRFGDAPSSS